MGPLQVEKNRFFREKTGLQGKQQFNSMVKKGAQGAVGTRKPKRRSGVEGEWTTTLWKGGEDSIPSTGQIHRPIRMLNKKRKNHSDEKERCALEPGKRGSTSYSERGSLRKKKRLQEEKKGSVGHRIPKLWRGGKRRKREE